eukprot:gene27393-33086_t
MGAGKGLSSSSPAASSPLPPVFTNETLRNAVKALGEWQVRGGVAGADEVIWSSCACHPLD